MKAAVLGAALASSALTAHDAQVDALLARMTLAEKIGQMTQADTGAIKDPEDIARFHLGSVLSGGGSDPKAGNSLLAWTDLHDELQKQTLKTRLKIPLLYGIDAVHGHGNVLGAVVFPHNIGLGCTRDPALVEKIGEITAREIRATGIEWTFAPTVAVVRDDRWGRTYEGFGEDTALVTELGAAAVRGLQGPALGARHRVLACAKHFVGDGATTFGTGEPRTEGSKERWGLDRGDMTLDEAEVRRLLLPPYRAAIDAGVGSIMISFNSWNGVKASASRRLMTEILKEEMGFQGFLVSDWAAIDEIPGDYASDVEKSINAGMDMVMVPEKYAEFVRTLTTLVEQGRVPMSRIDDAVRRILRVKFAMGLMGEKGRLLADRTLHDSFGSGEHRLVAREAVRKSLVLLKNDRRTLPLAKAGGRIHVAGRNADDLGNQCGGWTVDWQGRSGDVMPGGTTILAGIRGVVGRSAKVTFSRDGKGAAGARAAIVVIGETPYAEMKGDRDDISLDAQDVAAVEEARKAGIPVVVVLVSGRPLHLEPILGLADAIVAAWLPGTEGQGVADVLFGDHKPTGKLSYSWPRAGSGPVNVGDAKYDPLFPFGFGLSY